MANVTEQQLIGEFADAAISAIETVAKPEIIALIGTGEIALEAGLINLCNNLPKPAGIEGALAAPIEKAFAAAAETWAKNTVAKYGPDALFAILDARLRAWAKTVGG